MNRMRAAARRDDGTSALEFAIVAPLLVMLLGGIVAMGAVYARYIEVTAIAAQAARDAAAGYDVGGTTVNGAAISTSYSYDAPWHGYYWHDDHDYWGNPGGYRITVTAQDSFTLRIPFWSAFGGPSGGLTIPMRSSVTQRVLRGWTDYHHDDRSGSWGGYDDWGNRDAGWDGGWGGH